MSLWNIAEGKAPKKMMTKVNNEKMAKKIAKEDGLLYGSSVFDGKWYVGTREQLKKIGVVKILGEDVVLDIPRGVLEECACSLTGEPMDEAWRKPHSTEERRLFDAIMMAAENDGDSYRKRDPKGAIEKAIREMRTAEMREFNSNVISIKKGLIAQLTRDWKESWEEGVEVNGDLNEKDDTDYSDSSIPGRKSREERLLRGRGERGKMMAATREGMRLVKALQKKIGYSEAMLVVKDIRMSGSADTQEKFNKLVRKAIKEGGWSPGRAR